MNAVKFPHQSLREHVANNIGAEGTVRQVIAISGKRQLKSVHRATGHILPVRIANISHMLITEPFTRHVYWFIAEREREREREREEVTGNNRDPVA
jgi:hypothetical protein